MKARLAALVAALLLNVALLMARPAPALAWLHPVAPPLTHIPEMGEPVLAGEAAPSAGPPPGPGAPSMGPPPGTGAAGAPPGAPGPRTAQRVPPGPGGSPGPGGPPRGTPPLRGLAGAVERVVRATGTPDQRAALGALHGADVMPLARRATELRVAVESDAVALADALGPERVGAILARKDDLSTRIGEGRAWATAIERLR